MMEITVLVIGLLSLIVGTAMSLWAWRVLQNERLRSSVRVAALAAEIHDGRLATRETAPLREVVDDLAPRSSSPVAGDMFRAASPLSRLPPVATVAAILVGLAAAGTILFGGGNRKPVAAATQSRASRPLSPAPLELVALGHERDADGLTVRGVLRNPLSGSAISHLTAVVLLFNRDGASVASGRAVVQAATLGPGEETTFVVTVSGAPDVERYRVSFRTEHDLMPHVDMRS